jgi:hypothetical protein
MTRQRSAFTLRAVLVAVAVVAVMIGQLVFAATKISAAVSRLGGDDNAQTAQAAPPTTPRPAPSSFAAARHHTAGTFLLTPGR